MSSSLRTPFAEFSYHPHQESGIHWMITRESADAEICRGGILADEMGLGKTWTTIGLLLNSPVPNTLILTPPILLPQWEDALRKSGIPIRRWDRPAEAGEVSVSLLTYDRATRLVGRMLEADATPFDRIICDEGHVLRNNKTVRFMSLVRLDAPRRWILSGTPIQNTKKDFYNLVKWLNPAEDQVWGARAIADIILLRRVVAQVRETVSDFPTEAPVHHIHTVEMPAGSEEKIVFDRLVDRFRDAIEDQVKGCIILELYLRIRQFLAHPILYIDAMIRKYGSRYPRTTWTGTASKMDVFTRILADLPLEPTIVFGSFTRELDIAATTMQAAGYRILHIRGGMAEPTRAAVLRTARELAEAGTPVGILVQIVSGNAGLNMQYCSRVIFLSSHWNPSICDQAIGRAYRMGQTRRVAVHHILLADGSQKNLDRLIVRAHLKKRDLTRTILPSLVPDSAIDATYIIDALNQVCAEEAAPVHPPPAAPAVPEAVSAAT